MMDNQKPMRLLLIEDDVGECIKFKDCANSRTDITFVGMTDSSAEGMKLLKTRLPEGVILDLQLVKGEGSGLQFLIKLKEADLAFRPIVVVTTSNQSPLVYDHIENLGVDWIFCKKQKGYSTDFVVDTMLALRESLHIKQHVGTPGDRQSIESPEERRNRIYKRIDAELDLIGIRARFKGRAYLREGVYLQIHSKKVTGAMIDQVAANHNITYSTTAKVMQTAIDNAWNNASIDELKVHYTARVNPKTGSPSASDFIHYYADKIRKTI